MILNPNCSETVFRLTGSLNDIKREVLNMLKDIKENNHTNNTSYNIKVEAEIQNKIQQVKAVKSLREFEDIVFPFTTNYETFFKQDGNNLDVGTCNNISFDSVTKHGSNKEYYSIAKGDYWTIKLQEEKWIYVENKNTHEKKVFKKPILDKYSGTEIQIMKTKNGYLAIRTDKYLEEITDKELLKEIYEKIMVEEI